MNGRSLIGGAGDASPVPLWRNPFGNKAGEAMRGGFSRLKLALARGPPEQVGMLPPAASVSRSLGTCAPASFLSGAWEVGSSRSAESTAWAARMGMGLSPETHGALFMVQRLDG